MCWHFDGPFVCAEIDEVPDWRVIGTAALQLGLGCALRGDAAGFEPTKHTRGDQLTAPLNGHHVAESS
jgi:hypothetical protein